MTPAEFFDTWSNEIYALEAQVREEFECSYK